MGDTPQEKELCEANARALLTSWGSSPSTSIIDYAQRQWAGLLKDYYYPRWKAYISYQQKQLMGQSAEKPTFDKIVSSWNKRRNDYKNPISGNLLLVGASIIKKLNDTEK